MVFAAILKLKRRRRRRRKFSKYRLTRRGDASRHWMRMCLSGLSAHIFSLHSLLTSHFSAGLKSHPSYSTNTSGLTLFCTWLTARCLKYFPVCSRINCSSGNDDDDSSKKPKKKKRKKKEKNRSRKLGGKTEKLSTEACFCFWCFFFSFLLIFIIFLPGSVV